MSIMTSFLFASIVGTTSVDQPKPAVDLMAAAQSVAAQKNKNVMVIFHASWCGWCKRLDAFMGKPAFKPMFEKNFAIVHLVVLESPDKKALENPGGEEVMVRLGGKGAGLPFTAIVDKNGKLVANSLKEGKVGGNIGCPWEPDEVAWFMKMMDLGAKLNVKERKDLETGLLGQKAEKGG